jgi:stage V sporulation protein G
MSLQITEVTIHPTNEGLLKGYGNIVFDNCFMIREIRVIQGPTGHFVSLPAKKQTDGTHRQLAYPANAETRMMIQRVIRAEYEKSIREYFGVSNDETGIGEYYGNPVCLAVYLRRRNHDGCRDMSSGLRARA